MAYLQLSETPFCLGHDGVVTFQSCVSVVWALILLCMGNYKNDTIKRTAVLIWYGIVTETCKKFSHHILFTYGRQNLTLWRAGNTMWCRCFCSHICATYAQSELTVWNFLTLESIRQTRLNDLEESRRTNTPRGLSFQTANIAVSSLVSSEYVPSRIHGHISNMSYTLKFFVLKNVWRPAVK